MNNMSYDWSGFSWSENNTQYDVVSQETHDIWRVNVSRNGVDVIRRMRNLDLVSAKHKYGDNRMSAPPEVQEEVFEAVAEPDGETESEKPKRKRKKSNSDSE